MPEVLAPPGSNCRFFDKISILSIELNDGGIEDA